MNPTHKRLAEILHLARRARPPAPPPQANSEEAVFFARRVAAQWARTSAQPADPWRAWERVGHWSLAAAVAVMLVAAAWHPQSPAGNPFEPFISGDGEDNPFFDGR
jgi:hypothetical protein